jgi:hypothetical protein
MNILFYISSILLNASGDGVKNRNIGHALWAACLGSLLVIDHPVWYIALISYGLLRIALFDLAYNISAGLPLRFVGSTSWWDKAIKKVPFGFMLFVRGICLIVGICLLLGLQDRIIMTIKNIIF